MNRSRDSRSLLRRGIIRRSLITSLVNTEDRVTASKVLVDMDMVVGMEVHRNMLVAREVMVVSTKVHREIMEDIRAVIRDHQEVMEVSMVDHRVATHRREETRVDTQDTRAATQDTRACLRMKNLSKIGALS